MQYVILTCRKTLEFFRWGESRGLWIPMKPLQRVVNGQVHDMAAPAFAGYAFAPQYEWPDMRRHAPLMFAARVFAYDRMGRPRTCSRDELSCMQEAINHTGASNDPEPIQYAPGCKVKVTAGPFTGLFGVVSRCRNDKVRVMLGIHYIVMPISFVSAVK